MSFIDPWFASLNGVKVRYVMETMLIEVSMV